MNWIVLALLVGCNKSPPAQPEPEPAPQPAPEPVEEPVPTDAPEPPSPTAPAPASANPDPIGIYGASYIVTEGPTMAGTTLSLTATHGGGCEDHEFSPRLDPRSADAPATQVVHVHHEDNGDTCKRRVTTAVEVDLADRLQDCTEAIEVHAWPIEGEHVWLVALAPPYGCD